ncbi:hypothetical protein BDK51DRAFT_39359 [Blyttiomyces helicus]|uniref:Uncharacterized protein n=1 Tax=Blyttiomyces helicus TaxID=388810 RepID=A0A4P9W6U2_9FUNG|nr:hypothetical protein BDK51DRAFT_39359 [Blyttiomyces helicus]|eukprot:RKO87103.1 hypothetical protein BDK51DRAFT_39359 [Blyttiomyces helicus]
MHYTNRGHQGPFKRRNQDAQYAKEVTCAATMLQISIILFQTSLCVRHYLTTSCLVDPLHSFWHTLYAHRTNSNLILVIGFHRATFEDRLQTFSRFYIVGSGQERLACQGDLQARQSWLSPPLFLWDDGVPDFVRDVWRPPLHSVPCPCQCQDGSSKCPQGLKVLQDAQIRWPSFEQHQEWAHLSHAKELLLEGRWCLIDSKNYRVRAPTNAEKPNAMYNSETPRGKGRWFSSPVPCATGLMGRSSGASSNAITSLPQAVELGVGSTALVFPQLDQKLPYHFHVGGRRLANIYRLHNLRVHPVGITQIGTVFGWKEDLLYDLPDNLPHV